MFTISVWLSIALIDGTFGGTTRYPGSTQRSDINATSVTELCKVPVSTKYSWNREQFPNPQRDIQLCGRNCRKSWICDPNRILDSRTADVLDDKIRRIQALGQCGCTTCTRGYQIAVAIVPKMELVAYKTYDNEDLQTEASEFASYLRVKWNFGKCNDGVVIFISKDDRKVFTAIGPKAKPVLSINCTGDIFTKIKPILKEADNTKFGESAGMALETMVSRYGEVFQYGQCYPPPGKTTDSALGVIITLGIAVFIIFIIVAGYFGNKRCKTHRGDGRGSRNHNYYKDNCHKDDSREKEKLRSKDNDKFSGGETGDGGGVAGGGF